MSADIIIEVFAAVVSMLGAGVATELAPQLVRRIFGRGAAAETYSQKLSRLTRDLMKASSEVDNVLIELSQVARDRERTAQKLDMELRGLESREKQLQQTIHDLENTSIPAVEHFAKLTAAGERRSALRDYSLFGAGVVVSTVIAIILKLIGVG